MTWCFGKKSPTSVQRRAFDPPTSSTAPLGGGIVASIASNLLIVASHRVGPEVTFATLLALPLCATSSMAGSMLTIKLARNATTAKCRIEEGLLRIDISVVTSAFNVFVALADNTHIDSTRLRHGAFG
jgi:hypothetical protein